MKAVLSAQLHHMADTDLLAMIPLDTLARIRQADPSPEIRAYVIAHEGEAEGNMVGIGRRVMQYFRDAIIRLHDRLQLGTAIFHRHGQTNDHSGREPIGELVGKSLKTIGGKLHDVAAMYIKPQFRNRPLDIASIEADVTFTETDQPGTCQAVDIGDITGIALSSSSVERPGFAGATLLATIQAFVGGETKTMTLEELKAAAAELKAKPSDLFAKEVLAADPIVEEHVKAQKQTEYEHAKRIETKLAKEREDRQKAEADYEAKLKSAQTETLRSRSAGALDALAAERKLTAEQKAFVQKRFDGFKTEATDEDGLKADLQKHLDGELKEFGEFAKIYGVKTEVKLVDDPGTPPADKTVTPDGEDLTDPAVNDFIPKVEGGAK